MLDRELLFDRVNRAFPIIAAVASTLLNLLSFFIGIGFSASNLTFLGILLVGGLAIVSGSIVYLIYKFSLPVGITGYQRLDSTDEYEILDNTGEEAVWRHMETIKILQDGVREIRIHLDSTNKYRREFRSLAMLDKDIPPYDINPVRWAGGIALLISFRGASFKKGQIIKDIGFECNVEGGFSDTYGGFSVTPAPGQKRCCLRIIFPLGVSSSKEYGTWYISFPTGVTYDETGKAPLQIGQGGKRCIEHIFDNIPSVMGTKCTLSWEWEPATLETN